MMPMIVQDMSELFQKDLKRLSDEIALFHDASNLWMTAGSVANSAGNLCLHLNGNLNHFVGAILGNTGYVREREKEFEARHVSVDRLVSMTLETAGVVKSTLDQLTSASLEQKYPIEVFGQPMTTGYFLLHLYGHLNYHLGQINYLRRILEP
jgi:uncharacterized damage-inducible protein DinB